MILLVTPSAMFVKNIFNSSQEKSTIINVYLTKDINLAKEFKTKEEAILFKQLNCLDAVAFSFTQLKNNENENLTFLSDYTNVKFTV